MNSIEKWARDATWEELCLLVSQHIDPNQSRSYEADAVLEEMNRRYAIAKTTGYAEGYRCGASSARLAAQVNKKSESDR